LYILLVRQLALVVRHAATLCLIVLCSSLPASAQSGDAKDPDRLYANRTDLASARRAAELWDASFRQNSKNFEAAWKLARAYYWLGTHAPENERRMFLEKGVQAGSAAAMIEPKRPEGHFWMAANMGALADSYGRRVGLKYRRPIKEALETVRRLDPSFMQGSADRALGRWYFKVPGWLGGDKKLAEEHLRKSLTYNPNSTSSHFFLAELMLDQGRKAEAREELQRVLEASFDPEWEPENQDFKQKARALLKSLEASTRS
jgi:tetratricopeptide (TPR) repeat protein